MNTVRRALIAGLILASLGHLPVARADFPLYVSSPYGGGETVYRYDAMGNRTTFATLTTPQGLAVDGAGNLLVASELGQFIHRYSPSGALLQTIGLPSQGRGLAIDSSNSIYVALGPINAVHKYSPTGALLGVLNNGVSNPVGLALDAAQNLYVINNTGGGIRRFAPDGTSLGTFATVGGNAHGAIEFDASGNLYAWSLPNFGPTGQVFRLAPDGTPLGLFASVTNVNGGGGLGFDPAGNLYVTESLTVGGNIQGGIRRLSPTGADLGLFTSASSFYPTFLRFAPVPEPNSAALAGSGLILVVSAVAARRRGGTPTP